MTPDLWSALEATWPAADILPVGPWAVRRGLGGGKRVSATRAIGPWRSSDIPLAEAAMRDLDQPSLFVLGPGDAALDAELAVRHYRLTDPVTVFAAPVADLCRNDADPLTCFAHWPGLSVTEALWDDGGIDAARRAVMARVALPKAVLLGRVGDRAAGVAFVASAGDIAMLHAVQVQADRRRQGVGRNLLRGAAAWARDQGARTLALAVTDANHPARALYAALQMEPVGHYHYRMRRHDA